MSLLVSIIVLNWNGEQHLHRCLEHVAAQEYPAIEVIVVDNASSDGSLQRAKMRFPGFHYIENGENRGFAAGMNQGISASRGDFVIPLNQDVCLHSAFVTECVKRISGDGQMGAIGGRVFSWIGDQLTDRLRRGEGENYVLRKRFQADAGNFSENEVFTFAPTGSFPFFRMAMLKDIYQVTGYFYDEAFETGWEDTDLCFRMHLRGWKCLFLPAARGWHVGSGSVGGNDTFLTKSHDYQVRILRNRYFTMIKNLPLSVVARLLPFLVLTEIAIIPYLVVRSPRSLSALVEAWKQVLLELGQLMRKRSLIQHSRRITPTTLVKFFDRF